MSSKISQNGPKSAVGFSDAYHIYISKYPKAILFPSPPPQSMAPLSSCKVTGVFRIFSPSRNKGRPYFAHYLSGLQFPVLNGQEAKRLNISIRNFTPATDPLFENDTFVFVVAHAAFPASQDGILDCISCIPFAPPPGGFLQCYPIQSTHTAIITGNVASQKKVGNVQTLSLTISEYAQDHRRKFSVR